MAEKAKKQKSSLWKKGYCPNPGGMPKDWLALQPYFRETKTMVTKAIHDTARLSIEELTERLTNKDGKTLEAVVARLYSKAIAGSLPHARELLDRLIGAVPRNLVTEDANGETKPVTIQVNTDKLLAVMMQLNQLPEDGKCEILPDIT